MLSPLAEINRLILLSAVTKEEETTSTPPRAMLNAGGTGFFSVTRLTFIYRSRLISNKEKVPFFAETMKRVKHTVFVTTVYFIYFFSCYYNRMLLSNGNNKQAEHCAYKTACYKKRLKFQLFFVYQQWIKVRLI